MSGRLVPRYVSRAGWEVWNAYQSFLDDDDLDRLRDAIAGLRDALLRDPSTLREAPDDVLVDYLRSSVSGEGTNG